MGIVTEMPSVKAAWDTIANYESHDIVRARYQTKHGLKPSAALAREISAPFIQARRYYSSAANAERTVKPLLLHYGVLSLSRGLVLFLTRKLREASLSQSHGLSVTDWQSVLADDRPDISDLKIKVQRSGSFVELLTATKNTNLLRANSSAVNRKVTGGPVLTGTILELGEILARLPDIIDQFRRWKTPQCITFSKIEADANSNCLVTVPRGPGSYVSEALLIDIFQPENCDIISVDNDKIIIQIRGDIDISYRLTDLVADNFAGIGDIYIMRPSRSGTCFGKIIQLFAISHILSMLVRYYPAFWMDFVNQRIGDAAVPTVFKVIDCIETLYPQIVCDFLEER
jgi:hypothetical protein